MSWAARRMRRWRHPAFFERRCLTIIADALWVATGQKGLAPTPDHSNATIRSSKYRRYVKSIGPNLERQRPPWVNHTHKRATLNHRISSSLIERNLALQIAVLNASGAWQHMEISGARLWRLAVVPAHYDRADSGFASLLNLRHFRLGKDGFELETGKLPPVFLEELLAGLIAQDPRVVVGPSVGEDCAVVEFGERLLVAKSDPITFATDSIGWYAVQVNANDIACTGGEPRWFLPTVLLPTGASPDDVRAVFRDIANACGDLGVSVVGGHTEVTDSIRRTIVAGTMLGELEGPDKLVSTGGAQDGDSIIVTSGVAIEGTAILAREYGATLRKKGVDENTIRRASEYLGEPGISVVPAARALCETGQVHSLHDVTEGGLVTALREVATASGLGLVAEAESVPLLPECATICTALGIDPLGLLGSGALIATLPASETPAALKALDRIGVSGWEIGQMMEAQDGLWLIDREGERILPEFTRDELARFLEEMAQSSR